MKYVRTRARTLRAASHPARGGWIEMKIDTVARSQASRSHPARGGWIEIQMGSACDAGSPVPPRTGWVD